MNLQTINLNGQDFVLLPAACYKAKKKQIDKFINETKSPKKVKEEYVPFVIDDYFDNPVALERIKRGVTQSKLAKLMGCSQAYISQLERSESVSEVVLEKVKKLLKDYPNKWSKLPK